LVGGHATVRKDKAGHAVGREVDEVLHPGEVGLSVLKETFHHNILYDFIDVTR